MEEAILQRVLEKVWLKMQNELFINVEASGRHVHLNRECINVLFGEGYNLTKNKELSQPGQYACKERVTLIGPKGSIANVVILGPERKDTQVEISLTDALALGINAPVRESGDIENTPEILILSENAAVKLNKGVIVAKRHIHMSIEDAQKFNVQNKEIVKAEVLSYRKLIFDDVVVRVSKDYSTHMHIDYDEANACGYKSGTFARIIKYKGEPQGSTDGVKN